MATKALDREARMKADGRIVPGDVGATIFREPPGPPEKSPEEWELERRQNLIARPDVLKKMRWTDDDLAEALSEHGFPKPFGQHLIGDRWVSVFSLRLIERWRERFAAFAAKVR